MATDSITNALMALKSVVDYAKHSGDAIVRNMVDTAVSAGNYVSYELATMQQLLREKDAEIQELNKRIKVLEGKLNAVQKNVPRFSVWDKVWYLSKAQSDLWVEAVVTCVYTDTEDGIPYYDIKLVDGTVRQTVNDRLRKQ